MADAGNDHGLVAINQSLNVCFLIFFFFYATKIQKNKRPTEVDLYFVLLREGFHSLHFREFFLREGVLGMRSTNNRSLLNVNEDCEYKQ
jgi:hypothetical protein